MSISKPGPAPVQCPTCGEWLNEDDLYCRYCGRPMVATGFDDEGNVIVTRQPPTGASLRGVGERNRLPDPHDRRGNRGGALERVPGGALGCTTLAAILAALIIGVMLITWFLIRPGIAGSARDGIQDGLNRELSLHAVAPSTSSITIDEVTINEYLAASEAWFDPVGDLSVDLTDNLVTAQFNIYGLTGSFSSGLTVQDGLIRLVNPSASGAASRLINTTDIARAIETQLRIFVQNQGRPVNNITIDDGLLTVTFAE